MGSIRTTITALALLCLALAAGPGAQVEYTNNFKYNSGQGVQPIFEGWSHAPDGSINMHFGYLNRNYVEMPHDSRRTEQHHRAGRPRSRAADVLLPADQPQSLHGQRPEGLADQPRRRLDADRQRQDGEGVRLAAGPNGKSIRQAARAAVAAARALSASRTSRRAWRWIRSRTLKVSDKATLVATITDDGLPKPRPGGARRGQPVGQETPPTLRGGVEAPVNVPALARGGRGGDTPPGATAAGGGGGAAGGGACGSSGGGRGQQERPPGPTVSWIVWRGPADATFGRAEFQGDKRIVTATFTKPGEYTLRAVANDTLESSAPQFVKVVVQ